MHIVIRWIEGFIGEILFLFLCHESFKNAEEVDHIMGARVLAFWKTRRRGDEEGSDVVEIHEYNISTSSGKYIKP